MAVGYDKYTVWFWSTTHLRQPQCSLVPVMTDDQALSRPELHIPTKHASQEAGPGTSTKQQVSRGKAADKKHKGVKEEAAQQDWEVEDPGPGGRDKCSAAFRCVPLFKDVIAGGNERSLWYCHG